MLHRTHFDAIGRLFILYIASVISAEIAQLKFSRPSNAEDLPMFTPTADYTIDYNAAGNEECSTNCTSTPATTGSRALYKVGNTRVCSWKTSCTIRLEFNEGCIRVDAYNNGYYVQCIRQHDDEKICQNGSLQSRDNLGFLQFDESARYKCDCSGSQINESFCLKFETVISVDTGPSGTSAATTNTRYATPAMKTPTSTTVTPPTFSARYQFTSTPSDGPADEESTKPNMDRSTVIYIGVASGVVLLVVIAIIVFVILRRRRAAAHTPTAVRSTQSERGFGYHDGYEDCDLDVVNPQTSRNGSADRRVSSTSVDYDTAWHLPTNNSGQHPAPDLSQLYTTVNKPKKWKNENENANDSEFKRLIHQPDSTSNEEDSGDTSESANAAIPEIELVDNEIYGS